MPQSIAAHAERIPISDPFGAEVEDVAAVERYRFACRYVAGKRVLDVACGTGYGSYMLSRLGGARHVLGVDSASDAVAQGEGFCSPGQVELAVADATALPLADGSVDAVVTLETIEHVADAGSFLHELRRVLAPGGLLILSTPLNETETRFHPANPFHLREYSEDELQELLSPHFSALEVFYQAARFRDDPTLEVLESVPGGMRFRAVLRRAVPPAGRSLIRRVLRSPGRHCVAAEVDAVRRPEADVQIVVAR